MERESQKFAVDHRLPVTVYDSRLLQRGGVGRGRGVTRDLGVGVTLGVPVAVGLGVGVPVGLGVAVAVAVGVGVGVGVGPDCAQYLPPVLLLVGAPPQTIISLPVQTAVCRSRPAGAFAVVVAPQPSVPGLYLPPVFE